MSSYFLLPSSALRDICRQLGFEVSNKLENAFGEKLKSLTNLWAEMALVDSFYP